MLVTIQDKNLFIGKLLCNQGESIKGTKGQPKLIMCMMKTLGNVG